MQNKEINKTYLSQNNDEQDLSNTNTHINKSICVHTGMNISVKSEEKLRLHKYNLTLC